MKTRRILTASTAALLAFGSVAVVANAAGATKVEIDATGDWEEVGSTNVSYKAAKADAKKLEDLSISVEDVTASITDATSSTAADPDEVKALSGCGKLKTKALTNIANAVSSWDANKSGGAGAVSKASIYQISVDPADDDEYTSRDKFELKAKIGISIENLDFKADHVYHVDGDKLVEIEATKLTKKTTGSSTKYGIQFETKSFSPFIISEGAIKGAVALDDEENPANESGTSAADSTTSNGGTTTNPDTGIALAIAPVVLAAGAVAVVALKKKH